MEDIYGSPSALNEFLYKCITKTSGKITHTSIDSPKSSYFICDDKLDEFFKLYHLACFQFNKTLTLTEKALEYGCLRFDIDLKYDSSSLMEHEYSEDLIKELISNIQDLLKTYLDIDNDNIYHAYVLERNQPYFDSSKNKTKDGFHIVFPNCIINKEFHLFIIKRLKEICKTTDFFGELKNINAVEQIIDNASVTNNWLLYGSTKKKTIKPKLLAYVFNSELKNIFDEINTDEDELIKLLSIRKKMDILKIKKEYQNDIKSIKNEKSKSTKQLPKHYEEVVELLKIVSAKRAEEYSTWIEMGWCLHNIDKRYLPAWTGFSKKSSKFCEGECEKRWKGFKNEGLNIGTLYWWAKEDNLKAYKEFVRSRINPMIHESVLNQDLKNCKVVNNYDIAKVVKEIYRYEFKSLDLNSGTAWYHFEEHRWKTIGKKNMKLRKKFSNEIYEEYRTVAKQLYESETENNKDSDGEGGKKNSEFAVCDLIAKKLKSTPFKQELMTECIEVFCDFDSDFESKLDANIYYVCFKNGIYDLKNQIFRDGRPDDYLSLSTKINYKEYDPNHPKSVFIHAEIKKIIPDKEIREYLLRFFGSCLEGRNKQQKLHIFTGTGSNGKSILIEFLETIFGELACKIPIQYLCSKRGNSSGASPEIARTKGKRLVSMQEPDSTAKLNEGLVKEITGNDKIAPRALYKDPIEFIPQHKPIILCNTLPKISASDGGTQRRIVVVPFETKFVSEPKEDDEYLKDDLISEKLERCKEHGMAMLIHYYKLLQEEDGTLKPPKKITMQTETYLEDNDIFKEFINNALEESKDEAMGLNMINTIFKQWAKENYPESASSINRNMIKSYLMQYYPKSLYKEKWLFKIKYNEQDNEIEQVNSDDLDNF